MLAFTTYHLVFSTDRMMLTGYKLYADKIE